MRYQILLSPTQGGFSIVHVESNCHIGYADVCGAKYCVQNAECDDIGFVNSINEAIPTLLDYYEKHPGRWQRDSATLYFKISQFGYLQAEQDQSGHWLAYRSDYPLLRDGKPAIFPTFMEAQRGADAHLRDCPPWSEPINDGLAWHVSEWASRG
jgi:hypothetical protein